MMTFANIAAVIARSRDIVIATHVRPDGDCIGSALALARYVEGLGKTVRVWNVDAAVAGQKFHYLPGWEKIESPPAVGGFALNFGWGNGIIDFRRGK